MRLLASFLLALPLVFSIPTDPDPRPVAAELTYRRGIYRRSLYRRQADGGGTDDGAGGGYDDGSGGSTDDGSGGGSTDDGSGGGSTDDGSGGGASTTGPETEYWFDQLIDHTNPSLGTFKQRYYFDGSFWKGEGSPIILSSPGEQSADGFWADLVGSSLQNAMMQVFGGAGIVLEHRYWGKSSPFQDLTTDHLKYLKVAQAIDDLKYFAENVQLPWVAATHDSKPTSVPWVNIGCSYPGMLAAYTQETYPDLFAAAWASSAPVQADGDFWEYFQPIEEGMPKNCSADIGAAITYIDNLLTTGSAAEQLALKTKFGLEGLANDDFAQTLVYPIGSWQEQQPTDFAKKGLSVFYQWCDAVEKTGVDTYNQADTGIGLPQALDNWAVWFKDQYPDYYCPNEGGKCFSSYDYTFQRYTNTSVAYDDRAWWWLVCTELGWFQGGDPGNGSNIVSSLITVDYNIRKCNHMFPLADGTPGSYVPDTTGIQAEYQGWNVIGKNLFVTNGQYDPWRSASLSSATAVGVTKQTDGSAVNQQDITVIAGARHCWDWSVRNALVNQEVERAQTLGISQVRTYLRSWYQKHPDVKDNMPSPAIQLQLQSASTDAADAATAVKAQVQDKVDNLTGNKGLALGSYIANIVMALVILGLAFGLWRQRSGAKTKYPTTGAPLMSATMQGDKLGEYGYGARAGGRGTYQKVGGD